MKAYGEVDVCTTYSCPWHYLEVTDQLHAPAALPPEKEVPLPIGQEIWWVPEPV
jgi:hypothetical protein